MLKYLQIVRLPNLLMIPLTMYLLRWCIVKPMLDYQYAYQLQHTVNLQFSNSLFWVLVLLNMFLGAAGYVINDYFDRRIDSVNRKNSVLVGRNISNRMAIAMYVIFNVIAMFLACVLAYNMHSFNVLLMYIMLAGIFWFYSTTYKRQLLLGNVIVSVCTALVPLQVAYFEIVSLNSSYASEMLYNNLTFTPIIVWIMAFAVFAFLLNMMREIVKDIEDIEGDGTYGCDTLPLVYGIGVAKSVVVAIGIVVALITLAAMLFVLTDLLSQLYLALLVLLPTVISVVLTIRANCKKNYSVISFILKLVMLTGVLYALLARQIMMFVL
ncbi:MAG: geranylgeranylglycerol-phosphate geranylgeranyltransferase [Salinivirgaceae bacterium]|nr:geranylgeranylglycerol-phosphate geranylgeranyltransferase [Salinivirgaceae bacterium]